MSCRGGYLVGRREFRWGFIEFLLDKPQFEHFPIYLQYTIYAAICQGEDLSKGVTFSRGGA